MTTTTDRKQWRKDKAAWRQSKRLNGWKYINSLLPPEILAELLVYKNYLMLSRKGGITRNNLFRIHGDKSLPLDHSDNILYPKYL